MKRIKSGFARLFFLAVLLAVLSQAIYARPKVKCVWKKNPVTIDGLNKEWIGFLNIIEKESMALGVKRDEDFLYLGVLFSRGPKLKQVSKQGMIVWFDPEGGKQRKIGVQFPLGQGEPGSFQDPINHGPKKNPPMNQTAEKSKPEKTRFVFLVAEEDDESILEYLEAENIEVQSDQLGQTLFYELKIPLNRSKDQPIGIGVRSDKKLGIGFEASGMEEDRKNEYSRRYDSAGGSIPGSRTSGGLNSSLGGGIGSGIPGSMNTRMPGRRSGIPRYQTQYSGRPGMPETLNVWIQVEDIEKITP